MHSARTRLPATWTTKAILAKVEGLMLELGLAEVSLSCLPTTDGRFLPPLSLLLRPFFSWRL
jgi:hypothetical protein